MSRNNTGNPIGSKAFPDFEDNVPNLDVAVNSDQDTWRDRLGKSRLTWAGIEKAGTGDAGEIVPIVQQAAQQAASAVIAGVDGQVAVAENAADRAEAARDAAFVNADVYPDIASGLAAVADSEQFQVVEGDELVRYRKASDSSAEVVARYPSAAKVDVINSKLPPMLRHAVSVSAGLAITATASHFLAATETGAAIYETFGNLYNPSAAVVDRYIDPAGLSSIAAGWIHSDFIPVQPGGVVSISSNTDKRRGYAFYDSNKVALGPTNDTSLNPLVINVPANAAYMRTNVQSPSQPQPSEIMINNGQPAEYVPFGTKAAKEVVSLVARSEFEKITELVPSKNLYSPDDLLEDFYLTSANPSAISGGAGWACQVIPATEGDIFTIYSPSGAAFRRGAAFFAESDPEYLDTSIVGTYQENVPNTLVAPAGTQSLVLNVRSSTVATPGDFMVIKGSTLIPYQAPGSVIKVPNSALENPAGSVIKPLSVDFSDEPGAISSVISDTGITRQFNAIPEETLITYPVRFNLRGDYIDDVLLRDGTDDIAPDHIDGATVGANHGYAIGQCTAAAHGKTDTDCGSVWASGGNEYVLADVQDANTLLIARRDSNVAVPSGTFTHVSGATITANIVVTAATARQWYPPHKNWSLRAIADGKEVQPGGSVSADKIQFVEQADMVARADIIDAWIADGGMPASYEPQGPASIAQTLTYTYDRRGQITIAREWMVQKELAVQDLMGLQFGRVGSEETYIIPGATPFTYASETLDYSMGVAADKTLATGSSIYFDESNLQAAGEYAHRAIIIYPDAVFVIGFLPVADASYGVRRERVSNRAMEIRGNSGKLYFRVLDAGVHTAAAGDQYSVIGYRHILKKSPDRTAFYAVEGGGATWVYADWHNKEGMDRLPIDEQYPELIGRSFEVIEARNVTAKAGILAGSLPVIVSAATSSATLILKVT